MSLYGYTIEFKLKKSKSWSNHWNHKVYKEKDNALTTKRNKAKFLYIAVWQRLKEISFGSLEASTEGTRYSSPLKFFGRQLVNILNGVITTS